jgi:hypothetical protein
VETVKARNPVRVLLGMLDFMGPPASELSALDQFPRSITMFLTLLARKSREEDVKLRCGFGETKRRNFPAEYWIRSL